MKIKSFLLILFLLGITLTVFSQKKAELKYNLKKGGHYINSMKINQTIDMELQGQPMKMDQEISFIIDSYISEVYKDSFKIATTINRVILNQNIMGNQITYDSDTNIDLENPMIEQINKVFGGLLHKSIIQVYDKSGNIIRADLGELAEDEVFAQNFGSSLQLPVYPEGKTKIGDSWENNIIPLVKSGIEIKIKYTLEEIESGRARISFESTVDSFEDTSMNLEMNGNQTGEIIVDLKSGWSNSSAVKQIVNMTINQNGMTFPAKVTGKVITTSNLY